MRLAQRGGGLDTGKIILLVCAGARMRISFYRRGKMWVSNQMVGSASAREFALAHAGKIN